MPILPTESAEELLATRQVGYTGDVVRRSEELSRARVLPSLPPKDRCASIDVMDLCDSRMQEWFAHPENTLAPLSEVAIRPKPGKVMCEQSSLLALGRGLLERWLVKPLREKDLIQVAGEPLLNGLFGVPKGVPAPEDPEGREVLRLIMNLTATNSVSVPLEGDIGALPYFAKWHSLILGPDEELLWS